MNTCSLRDRCTFVNIIHEGGGDWGVGHDDAVERLFLPLSHFPSVSHTDTLSFSLCPILSAIVSIAKQSGQA